MPRRDTGSGDDGEGHDEGTDRRRFLAGTAATGFAGLAGCGGSGSDDADPGATDPGEEPSTDSTDATPTPRPEPDDIELAPFWTTGEKVGVGTAVGDGSGSSVAGDDADGRVWYTLTRGALTGVRFPRVDLLNVRRLDFLVADGEGYAARTAELDRRTDDDVERTVVPTADDALCYRHEFASLSRAWTLDVEYVADPDRDAVVVDVSFDAGGEDLSLYAVCRPAVTTGTAGDRHARATAGGDAVLSATDASDGGVVRDADGDDYDVSLALATDPGFEWATATPVGDPATARLLRRGIESERSREASGNAALVGRLGVGATDATVALGFAVGTDPTDAVDIARESVAAGFEDGRESYRAGWRSWLDGVDVPDSVAGDATLEPLYRTSAMALRAAEDATYPGAGVASPCVPWGEVVPATNPSDVGYHYVWSRDLYQSFTALEAMGRTEAAIAAAEYLFDVQQREGGFIPQNTYVDGRTRWGGEQLDEVAFPLVLARRVIGEHGRAFDDLAFGYNDVAASADYVLRNGPGTGQERWEEEGGLSPSTIAAEIAGLVSAAAVALEQGRTADTLVWLATADRFRRGVREWCVTREGTDRHDPPYYFRINGNRDPDDGTERSLANGGRSFDERNVIDAGFLELVRLGVLPADDGVIERSLAVVDDAIRVETPEGPAFYRYTGDGYGEGDDGAPFPVGTDTQGRLWPLLTGERAEYELAAGTESGPDRPSALLSTLAGYANEGRLLPEQVWDREDGSDYDWTFGEGTGSATPLSWSHAAFVRLANGIDAGRPLGTPAVVRERYTDASQGEPTLDVSLPDSTVDSTEVTITGETDASTVAIAVDGDAELVDVDGGTFEATVSLDAGRNTLVVAAGDPGRSAAETSVAGARTVVSVVE